jgi:hypothetical protein
MRGGMDLLELHSVSMPGVDGAFCSAACGSRMWASLLSVQQGWSMVKCSVR